MISSLKNKFEREDTVMNEFHAEVSSIGELKSKLFEVATQISESTWVIQIYNVFDRIVVIVNVQ